MKTILLILTLLMMGCGERTIVRLPGPPGADGADGVNGIDGANGIDGQDGVKGDQGDKGDKGDQGDRGENGVILSTFPIPDRRDCVQVAESLWIENDGRDADVFNNDQCDRGPDPFEKVCDDVREGHVCWASPTIMISIIGRYDYMIAKVMEFK